jgi:hypothetical protein
VSESIVVIPFISNSHTSVWAEVRKEESLEKYINFIKDQFSPMRNYRTYRALVQQGMDKPEPLIPFIGVQLQGEVLSCFIFFFLFFFLVFRFFFFAFMHLRIFCKIYFSFLFPFLASYSDLLFVDEGNPNYVADSKLVNFEKLQMYSTVVLGKPV